MPILLQVQSYLNQALPQLLSRCFDATGGTLGRSVDNQLVLEDPTKYISRIHARIEFHDGGFYLTAVGSNPTLVNSNPLGRNRSVLLNDADQLTIGDYQLVVQLNLESQGLPPAPMPAITSTVQLMLNNTSVDDSLSDASILRIGTASAGQRFDQLGSKTLATSRITPQPATLAFRGTESDHIAPEIQSFQMPVASHSVAVPVASHGPRPHLIPADYDPLADFLPLAAPVDMPVVGPIVHTALVLPELQPEPAAVAPQSTVVKDVAAPVESDTAVTEALLRGLGLPEFTIKGTPVEFAEAIGSMLRVSTAGTMEVLSARATAKDENRLDMTMMRSQANNPLKFFSDAASALTQLLSDSHDGYMTPVQSYINAFDDIKAHELAIMVGMRAALAGILERFDPTVIEQHLEVPTTIDKMFVANRKAKMWDGLVGLYNTIVNEADEDFERLFGEKFRQAYNEQIQRLHRDRK